LGPLVEPSLKHGSSTKGPNSRLISDHFLYKDKNSDSDEEFLGFDEREDSEDSDSDFTGF
jgi:hypothetical protein